MWCPNILVDKKMKCDKSVAQFFNIIDDLCHDEHFKYLDNVRVRFEKESRVNKKKDSHPEFASSRVT